MLSWMYAVSVIMPTGDGLKKPKFQAPVSILASSDCQLHVDADC